MKKSRRYCVKCKKVTTFKLKKIKKNDMLRHSKCSKCGNVKALNIEHAIELGLIKQGGR